MHKKKERTSREKKHKRINRKDVFATNDSSEVSEEEGSVSAKPWEGILPLGHCQAQAQEETCCFRKGAVARIFLWWPYSFPPISLSPSLFSLLCLPGSPLLFFFFLSSSSPNLSSFKERKSRHSICIHLFSFCCHFLWTVVISLAVLVWRNRLNSFMFFLPPTWFLGKTSSWKYGNYTLCIYEFVEIYHLLRFATALSI